MALRTGMTNLVARVRALTGAGTAEYTAGTVTYWTDDHLQTILDANGGILIDSPLTWLPQSLTAARFNGFWLNPSTGILRKRPAPPTTRALSSETPPALRLARPTTPRITGRAG